MARHEPWIVSDERKRIGDGGCAALLRRATTPSYLLLGAVWLTIVSGCLFSCVAGQGNRIAEPRTSITSSGSRVL
jgi:hypothetical protein